MDKVCRPLVERQRTAQLFRVGYRGSNAWNDVRVQSPASSPFGRRAFLTGIGGTALVAVTGCANPFSSAPTTRTVTSDAPPPVDPLMTLLATTRLHLARIDTGLIDIAADPAGLAILTLIQSDRAAHLAALEAEVARTTSPTSGSAVAPPTVAPTATVPTPAAADVLSLVLGDCVTAQTQFRDGVQSTSRYRAALFGSISACLATHRLVLQPS